MAAVNDGNVPFGSQVITIGATSFVAENINYTEPSNIIERRDEDGDPSGQVIINGFGNGSATLQFALSTTVTPTVGATFFLTKNSGATIGCLVSEVGETFTQLDAKKANISFRRRYN